MHLIQFNFFPPRGNCLDFFNGEITAAPATIFFSLFFSSLFFFFSSEASSPPPRGSIFLYHSHRWLIPRQRAPLFLSPRLFFKAVPVPEPLSFSLIDNFANVCAEKGRRKEEKKKKNYEVKGGTVDKLKFCSLLICACIYICTRAFL